MAQGFFQRIKSLSSKKKLLFGVALCQRMQPNFALFCQEKGSSDIEIYNNVLLVLWQHIYDPKLKINYALQIEKLEKITPEPKKEDVYAAYPALDAVVALSTILHALDSKLDNDLNNISKLSSSTVSNYIVASSEHDMSKKELSDFVFEHPLMHDEKETQATLLEWIETPESTKTEQVKGLRASLIEQSISNLGICLAS